tara:strand:- start:207 stop:599 length:393 start_codon:yes stop_codon:yes gene_type:complete
MPPPAYRYRSPTEDLRFTLQSALNDTPNPSDASATQHDAPQKRHRKIWRERIFAILGVLFASTLLLRFARSRWGEWPWYFSPREAGFDRIELFVFFLFPLGVTAVMSIFAGRARRWILGLLALTFLLSLV